MITKIIQEEKIQKAKKYVEKGESFVIVTHVSPDGDALGSSLGLYHFLSAYGKDNVAVVVPNAFPSFYRWMPGAKDVVIHEKYPDFAEKLIKEADVIFCLDFNEPKRIEKLAPAVIASEGRKVMIDHHLNPADFCRVTMSYPEMSSTSEMIFRFICRMGMFDLLNRDAAACIYTGMMTDTGSFTYNSNKPEIYTIVSELIKKGIDKDLIYRKVNQVYSECRLRMMGYVLYEKMRVYPEQQAALFPQAGTDKCVFPLEWLSRPCAGTPPGSPTHPRRRSNRSRSHPCCWQEGCPTSRMWTTSARYGHSSPPEFQ